MTISRNLNRESKTEKINYVHRRPDRIPDIEFVHKARCGRLDGG